MPDNYRPRRRGACLASGWRWTARDGRHSAIDQAPITGESVLVEKAPGDEVFAGTINQQGAGIMKSLRRASETRTVLARIIHAVEQAQGTRADASGFE